MVTGWSPDGWPSGVGGRTRSGPYCSGRRSPDPDDPASCTGLPLYEYGNDTLSVKSGYIRQVLPFITDLDKVFEKLHALFTDGGSEFVGQAIQTSVKSLSWTTEPGAMKFVFVAGNEEFDQGPVTAADAMKEAAAKDITVQLIFAGTDEPTWKAAAKLAKSDLVTIDQDQVAQYVPSPHDADILALGNQLNQTYIAYGDEGRASIARQASADESSAKLSPKVALERAQLNGKRGYRNESWDVVDAVQNNRAFLAEAPDNKLPTELRGKTLAEKQRIVTANAAKRAELQGKIAKLEAARTAFLDAERTAGGKVQSLESELMKSTRSVASKKGFK